MSVAEVSSVQDWIVDAEADLESDIEDRSVRLPVFARVELLWKNDGDLPGPYLVARVVGHHGDTHERLVDYSVESSYWSFEDRDQALDEIRDEVVDTWECEIETVEGFAKGGGDETDWVATLDPKDDLAVKLFRARVSTAMDPDGWFPDYPPVKAFVDIEFTEDQKVRVGLFVTCGQLVKVDTTETLAVESYDKTWLHQTVEGRIEDLIHEAFPKDD